jgi:lysine biosynthesis protein LysW
MAIAFCPDCDEKVPLGPHPRIGRRVTCPHCTAELEVIEVSPPELDWARDLSEVDWDDDGEWDEDDEDALRAGSRAEAPELQSGLRVESYFSTAVPFPYTSDGKGSVFAQGAG